MIEATALSVIQRSEVSECMEGRSIRVLGIDLGTTNSTISEAVWEVGVAAPPRAQCLEVGQPALEGEYTHVLLPSVVERCLSARGSGGCVQGRRSLA